MEKSKEKIVSNQSIPGNAEEIVDYASALKAIALDTALDEKTRLALKDALFNKATNEVCCLRERLAAKETALVFEKIKSERLQQCLCEARKEPGVEP